MAKGRSHSRSRDDYSVANTVFEPQLRPTWLSRPVLDPIHDLRVYNPTTQLLGPLEVSRPIPGRGSSWSSPAVRSARISYMEINPRQPSVRTNRFGDVIRINNRQRAIAVFQKPRNVPICVRRSQRKEVLFARGRVGRGYRKPRWKERSYMRCK